MAQVSIERFEKGKWDKLRHGMDQWFYNWAKRFLKWFSKSLQVLKHQRERSSTLRVLKCLWQNSLKFWRLCFFQFQRDLFWESLDMIYQILWPINAQPKMILNFLCEYWENLVFFFIPKTFKDYFLSFWCVEKEIHIPLGTLGVKVRSIRSTHGTNLQT